MSSDTAAVPISVAILDFGGQYAKLIDREVRALSVYSLVVPAHTSASELRAMGVRGVILSGGPSSVYGEDAPAYDPDLFGMGDIPVLGICYGMQLMAAMDGGKVEKTSVREDAQMFVRLEDKGLQSALFADCVSDTKDQTEGGTVELEVLLTHGDSVTGVGEGWDVLAVSSGHNITAAIQHSGKQLYGVQFHPEVHLSKQGPTLFRNFLFSICGLEPSFSPSNQRELAIDAIRMRMQKSGAKRVLVLVSGGVDSSVCAALLCEALGSDRVYGLHINNGFMRRNESVQVIESLAAIGFQNLKASESSETFYSATTSIDGKETAQLKEVLLPEPKRKIIGDTFMRITQQALIDMKLDPETTLLCQGTLRTDLIESAGESKASDVIKTHHNDTNLVRRLRAQGRIIEPLSEYHKDGVRVLGGLLGLPDALVWRHPFPGPGLAIRILCLEEPYTSEHDAAVVAGLKTFAADYNAKYEAPITTALLPCRTVGVQGDCRCYSSLVAVQCGQAIADLDWPALVLAAKQIPMRIHHVNRVVFVFGDDPLPDAQLLDVTPTHLDPECISLLQEADDIVTRMLLTHDISNRLSQVPVILLPVSFGQEHARAVCIRTFVTSDFMTGLPATPSADDPDAAMPTAVLQEIVDAVLAIEGISRVCYDLTAKPPATTEFE
jgi:GMP synthase (glutamine-hydrolysing)